MLSVSRQKGQREKDKDPTKYLHRNAQIILIFLGSSTYTAYLPDYGNFKNCREYGTIDTQNLYIHINEFHPLFWIYNVSRRI